MKKRILQKWLISSLLIVCVICATLSLIVPSFKSQSSIGPAIHYYYDLEETLVEAADNSEFVSAIESTENVNSVYVLDYEVYDMSFTQFTDLNASKAEVDSVIEDLKAGAKAYYSSKNQEFLSSIGVDESTQDYQVVVSNYSPYIQIKYKNLKTFQKYAYRHIDTVSNNKDIQEINITTSVEYSKKESVVSADWQTPYNMEELLEDIGVQDNTYSGAGLNVGIMEAEGVAYGNSHVELEDLDIQTVDDSLEVSIHAIRVTRLLCGKEGVAKGVNGVYIYQSNKISTLLEAMDWFIERNCSVVNASLGNAISAGKYIWTSAFIDFHVRYNRITFVSSAGNEGNNSNHYVTPPSTGYNIISVGNSTKNNCIYKSSSYGVESDLNMNKPTFAAPGTGIYINGKIFRDDGGVNAATSYAAPIATGVIIKLFDEFPVLQLFPEAVTAILIVSATNATGQSDRWDSRAGAGIINYQRARMVARNSYRIFINNKSRPGSTIFASEEFNLESGKKIRTAGVWSANSQTRTSPGNVQKNIHTDYNIYLVNINSGFIWKANGLTNTEFFTYKNKTSRNVKIEVRQNGDKPNNEDDYGAIAWYIE